MLHLKRRIYEARLTAYEAFCGCAAKYEAPLTRYEAKPFQASCFFAHPGKKVDRLAGSRSREVGAWLKSLSNRKVKHFQRFIPRILVDEPHYTDFPAVRRKYEGQGAAGD